MNRNTIRFVLAGVAAFYVVIGGIWALDYFPLQKFYAQIEVQNALIQERGAEAFGSEEYRESTAYQQAYAVSYPDILTTESKLAFLQSLLLWGTVALAVVGGVLLVTRRKTASQAPASPAD